MVATNRYKRVRCQDIIVATDRQRKKFDTSDLEESIRKIGVIQPIIIDQDHNLIAGERRLRASISVGLADIPCRFFEDLTFTEAKIIELEENLKRQDLDWREEVCAVSQIHELYLKSDEEWNQTRTAEALSIRKDLISMYLRVAKDINNPKIANAGGMRPAWNILSRQDSRKISDVMSDIIEAGSNIFSKITGHDEKPKSDSSSSAKPEPEPQSKPIPKFDSILNVDFTIFAPSYNGKPFNFIHCDFPYGVNLFGGKLSGRDQHVSYSDTPDIYWTLCKCLADNLDKLMTQSAHLLFWLPADPKRQVETMSFFREHAPSLDFWDKPLIWQKSDNVGIIQDPKRGPRHIYEAALFASRGDRLIVKSVSDAYSASTDKSHHVSTKPEPMLRHFMSMFVDETTRMLDPTCGSGSSLRAAESLGAEQVLGLELDKENFEAAKSALRSFRTLRTYSRSQSDAKSA